MTTSVQVTLPDHAERRRLRDEAGYSMAGVAARVGVSPAAFYRWERDRDPSSAEAIAEMLEQEGVLEEMARRVEKMEDEVKVFGGLPADREAARKEVARLEVEVDALRRRRDAMFQGLVEK